MEHLSTLLSTVLIFMDLNVHVRTGIPLVTYPNLIANRKRETDSVTFTSVNLSNLWILRRSNS